MSFKINDLVLYAKDAALRCPPISCFNTEITGVQILGKNLGEANPAVQQICNDFGTQAKVKFTPEEIKMLEAKLEEALKILKSM
jgi:hypothetical protein